ncbi:MAG: 2,3-bisphosphoglycerate-independent phosphoglycerate mutase [Candidatus Anstonellales archaeon]
MKPLLLIVLDGFGFRKAKAGNAIALAEKPFIDSLFRSSSSTLLNASGVYVGLPEGFQGNSEVGHIHLGSGAIVKQPLSLINDSIKDGSFYENKLLCHAFRSSSVHIIGLCSDAGVHSDINHIKPLLKMAKNSSAKTYIHCFLDGRDVPEKSALKYIKELSKWSKGIAEIATAIGRYYAMDRDSNWDRTEVAYRLLTEGKGTKVPSIEKGIQLAYSKGDRTDYYVRPLTTGKAVVTPDSSVIFINFRSDRARQLASAFCTRPFTAFPVGQRQRVFVGFSQYDPRIRMDVAFPQKKVEINLAKALSSEKISQLRIAETEKYAHVTYFFNSQVEEPEPYEDRVLVPSKKVASYDQAPEMSAPEITEEAISRLSSGYGFILVNYANPDLVGHSGSLDATIKAIEAIDSCLSKVVPAAISQGYTVVITADHGNAEEMLKAGKPNPSHTTNPVPFLIVGSKKKLRKGSLIDVAPTVLSLMGLPIPKKMEGRPLL